MTLQEPSSRRFVPVRLCDVPEDVRLRGARQACKAESDPDTKAGILLAAVMPSSRVYYVAPGARHVA